jgi:hypothetical protein
MQAEAVLVLVLVHSPLLGAPALPAQTLRGTLVRKGE